jgi:hypothetical protein
LDYRTGIISGHDSLEHRAKADRILEVNGRSVLLKTKDTERMITMLMRREDLMACYPYPHYRNRDVDWELTQWNPNAVVRREREVYVACGYVLHLGIGTSTWSGQSDPHASPEEVREVREILASHGIAQVGGARGHNHAGQEPA